MKSPASDISSDLGRNEAGKGVSIRKPATDKRSYRLITLANGIRVLLVSDPNDANPIKSTSDASTPDDGNEAAEGAKKRQRASTSEDSEGPDDGRTRTHSMHSAHSITDEDGDSNSDSSQYSCSSDGHESEEALEEKLAGVALCVGVGSFAEPSSCQGLAHFLEHMVFMGSEKYPDENYFDAFLNKHGGSEDAYTDFDKTVFYFEIDPKRLPRALDVFAQFFIGPLLKKDGVDRELEAVHSEYEISRQKDDVRLDYILIEHACEGHPIKTFSHGSRESLGAPHVLAQLDQFRKSHYAAQNMTLTVMAPDSFENLQSLIEKSFSAVPRSDVPATPEWLGAKMPFESLVGKMIQVTPIKSNHQLHIIFYLSPVLQHYLTKPVAYIDSLVAHEAQGSILAYLKRRGLATSLIAGCDYSSAFDNNEYMMILPITIRLTDRGLNHWQQVTAAVFAFINMLRRSEPSEAFFEETRKIAENSFEFYEVPDTLEYVQLLAANMQVYPAERIIDGGERYFQFDPVLIRKYLDELSPSRCTVVLSSKQLGALPRSEKWYGTQYDIQDISSLLAQWADTPPFSEFKMPEKNRFIAEDFSLLDCSSDAISEVPIKAWEDGKGRLWFKQDCKFKMPKVVCGFHLISPLPSQSLQSAVLFDLYVSMLNFILDEETYLAKLASYEVSLFGETTGLTILLSGFHDKLQLVFELLVDEIAALPASITEELFSIIREQMKSNYYNFFVKARKLNRDVLGTLLRQRHWTAWEKHGIIDSVDCAQLKEFAAQFSQTLFIEGLIQGNIRVKDATDLFRLMPDRLVQRDGEASPRPELHCLQLPKTPVICQLGSLNKNDSNSIIHNYRQIGVATLEDSVLNEFIQRLKDEPVFNELRTKQQLGYVAMCFTTNTLEVLGCCVYIEAQATKFSVMEVNERIETFLDGFKQTLLTMNEEEFGEQVDGLLLIKRRQDLRLEDEFDRHWQEIKRQVYVFDRRQREVQVLSGLTLTQVQEWYQNVWSAGARISVQVAGTGEAEPAWDDQHGGELTPRAITVEGCQVVTSIDEFKKSMATVDTSKSG